MPDKTVQSQNPSLEEFQVTNEKVAQAVRTCPKWTREQFKKNIKPCDVIIAYKKAAISQGLISKVFGYISRKLQGSSFSSCKMVSRTGDSIIGYAVDEYAKTAISQLKIDKFFHQHEAALVLRYKGITDDKRAKILEEFYKYVIKDTSYDSGGLITHGIFAKLFGTINKAAEDKEFSGSDQKKLICSSIVLLAYKNAGCPIQHEKKVGDRWIFPYEYITSPSFTLIGSYWSQESGVKKTGLEQEVKDPEKDTQPEQEQTESSEAMTISSEYINTLDSTSDLIDSTTSLINKAHECSDVLDNIRTTRDMLVIYRNKALKILGIQELSEATGISVKDLTSSAVIKKLTEFEAEAVKSRQEAIENLNGVESKLKELYEATVDTTGYFSVAHQRAKMLMDAIGSLKK